MVTLINRLPQNDTPHHQIPRHLSYHRAGFRDRQAHGRIGALIASLPFVTIMVMNWLYVEKQGSEKIANHAYYTLWYVVPTLPMFVLIPLLLRRGCNFWLTMAAGVALTFASFLLTVWVGKKFGVQLMP